MKVKRLKTLRVNGTTFNIKWDKTHNGGSFSYAKEEFEIGTKQESRILTLLIHELWEIITIEMHVRYTRPDVLDDYLFVYDHRQHDTMCDMLSGLLDQFL